MTKIKQPGGLISVLLDISAEIGDRDDAAMDLGIYDESEAEEALIQIVCNLKEDEDILSSAAESLHEIWNRKLKWDKDIVKNMHPEAKKIFVQTGQP